MTPWEVTQYLANGMAWFVAGMYFALASRKDRREALRIQY